METIYERNECIQCMEMHEMCNKRKPNNSNTRYRDIAMDIVNRTIIISTHTTYHNCVHHFGLHSRSWYRTQSAADQCRSGYRRIHFQGSLIIDR